MTSVKPSTYIIGIIIFTFLLVGANVLFAETFVNDQDKLTSERYVSFNKTFNKMSNVTDNVDDIEENLINSNTDPGLFGVLNSLIQSTWQSLRLITQSFVFMIDIFYGLFTEFGIPKFIPTLIIALVVVVLAFSIYSAIFQRDI